MSETRLQDVAARAGVSITAASMALSGKGRISDAVRDRVIVTARELGYVSRRHRAMSQRLLSRYVGIVHEADQVHEWDFIRPIIQQCQELLIGRGYSSVLIPVTHGEAPETIYEKVLSSGVGAALTIHYCNEDVLTRLEARGIPVIVINNTNTQDKFYSVCVDDFQGAYEGALYLCELGHRNILFVEYDRPDHANVVIDRFIGFRKALDQYKIPFQPEQRISIEFMDTARLESSLRKAFSARRPPTAIFCHDDYLAVYVIDNLQKLGLRVPEDASIIAPGDVLRYEECYVPRITTMRINTGMLGRVACNLLMDRIDGNDHGDDIHVLKVKQQIVKRGSCRARPDGEAV